MPTLPLSGGKLKTVTASFFCAFFLLVNRAQLMARSARLSMRSCVCVQQ